MSELIRHGPYPGDEHFEDRPTRAMVVTAARAAGMSKLIDEVESNHGPIGVVRAGRIVYKNAISEANAMGFRVLVDYDKIEFIINEGNKHRIVEVRFDSHLESNAAVMERGALVIAYFTNVF